MSQDTSTQNEEWLPVPGYGDSYAVSSYGKVRSIDRCSVDKSGRSRTIKGKILKPALHQAGYPYVSLYRNNKPAKRCIHQIVLEAFVGPRPTGMEACHIDGDPTNNHVSNLRWGSPSSNNYDRVRHGTHNQKSKTHCPRGHRLGAPNNRASYEKRGYRECLSCAKARDFLRRKKGPLPSFLEVADGYYETIMSRDK